MLLVACSSNVEGPAAPPAPATPNAANTIPLYPGKVIADHSPAHCGTQDMPYTAGDLYMLQVIGDMTRAPLQYRSSSTSRGRSPSASPWR